MNKKLIRKPLWLSTLLAVFALTALCTVWILILEKNITSYGFIGMCGAIITCYVLFNIVIYIRKRKASKAQHIETEDESLSRSISALLARSGKKPVYLLIGNKHSGKSVFLELSNAIKPLDRKRTVKNDFFEWYESDVAVYIKPDQRLLFQEQSSSDHLLWEALISELILAKPRKPIAGCLFFCDFEFLIVHEDEQIEYTLNALMTRLEYLFNRVSTALPIYLLLSKLDKLDGFKEFVTYSPLKSHVEFLSIPLKDAKGAIRDYFIDSFLNLIATMEKSALDSSSHTNNTEEKQAILTFPKQFELCQSEILRIIDQLNSLR